MAVLPPVVIAIGRLLMEGARIVARGLCAPPATRTYAVNPSRRSSCESICSGRAAPQTKSAWCPVSVADWRLASGLPSADLTVARRRVLPKYGLRASSASVASATLLPTTSWNSSRNGSAVGVREEDVTAVDQAGLCCCRRYCLTGVDGLTCCCRAGYLLGIAQLGPQPLRLTLELGDVCACPVIKFVSSSGASESSSPWGRGSGSGSCDHVAVSSRWVRWVRSRVRYLL